MSRRFEQSIGVRLCEIVVGMGIPCRVTPPRPELHGGCGIEGCCGRHTGTTSTGEPMVSLETPVSGTKLHRIAVEHGLPVRP